MNFAEWCAYIYSGMLERTPLIDGRCVADLIGTQEPGAQHARAAQIFLNREQFDKAVTQALMAVRVHAGDAEGAGKALTDAVIAHVQLMQETTPNWRDEPLQ